MSDVATFCDDVATFCDDVATFCDECSADIAYGVACYMPRTGEIIDGLPVVRIVCATCYAKDAT